MIALAGGAAGGVAVVSPRIRPAIVGVAVATALLHPLAATQSDLPSPGDGSKLVLRVRFSHVVIVTPGGPVLNDDNDEGDQ
jgi:hypothetical protein